MPQLSVKTPIGWLLVSIEHDKVVEIDFRVKKPGADTSKSALDKLIKTQLQKYFAGQLKKFSVPLTVSGTEFQQRVWCALQHIPFGQVKTYGELASELNSSARAIGNACHANPIPVIIPCHRVIAANGLGGYAGKTAGPVLERKRWLLEHEGVVI